MNWHKLFNDGSWSIEIRKPLNVSLENGNSKFISRGKF